MEKINKLIKILIDELENSRTSKTGELQAGELEALERLSVTAEKLYKICRMEEEDGYSQAGDWEMQGRGNSYAGRKRDAMGRYSREGGNSYAGGGYSRGRGNANRMGNSYDDDRKEMMEHLYMMEESANNERDREMIRRFKEQLERG